MRYLLLVMVIILASSVLAGCGGDDSNFRDSGDRYDNGTTPIGYYQANDYGLYDMHGNVREWCFDQFDEDYYKESPTIDPHGSVVGLIRIARGGSWFDNATSLRSAYRDLIGPGGIHPGSGFRPVRSS